MDEKTMRIQTGTASDKGWRSSMEDAVSIMKEINGTIKLYVGLFDGHGGDEVSKKASNELFKAYKPKIYLST